LEKVKFVNDVLAGLEVFADSLITNVFHNLIHNALRHGGKVTAIHFSVEEVEGARAVVCEDDGVGISADIKEKLFTKDVSKDHGHGLFLSREILAITGITITEQGEPGHGAKFVMTPPEGGLREPS
jgi:signal transduction histidine kinase